MTIIENAYMLDLINRIKDELTELKNKERNEYYGGERNAFMHVLRTIKAFIDEDSWKDFGLDFDIDKEY